VITFVDDVIQLQRGSICHRTRAKKLSGKLENSSWKAATKCAAEIYTRLTILTTTRYL